MTNRAYECHKCFVKGVKLWRDYGTPFHWDLWCVDCACAQSDGKIDPATVRDDGTRIRETHIADMGGRVLATIEGPTTISYVSESRAQVREVTTDQLGWYVPAIPSDGPKEAPDGYWGYSSVTDHSDDYEWWLALPLRQAA